MQRNKVSLTDLIAKADAKKSKVKKRKELYIKSLDGTITIEQPDRALCLEALSKEEKGDDYLVYECVVEPKLKDQQLRDAYECMVPIDIVEKVFEPGEIASIAVELITLAGYGPEAVQAVEDLKN